MTLDAFPGEYELSEDLVLDFLQGMRYSLRLLIMLQRANTRLLQMCRPVARSLPLMSQTRVKAVSPILLRPEEPWYHLVATILPLV